MKVDKIVKINENHVQYVHSKTDDHRQVTQYTVRDLSYRKHKRWKKYLKINVKRQWSARSRDLFPNEHLWDHLGRQVRERHDVNKIRDLEHALQAERVRIPLQVIRKLICSMRRLCMAVLAANGEHTRYWAVSEFFRLTPSSFHVRRRINAAKLWNNIDAIHWW